MRQNRRKCVSCSCTMLYGNSLYCKDCDPLELSRKLADSRDIKQFLREQGVEDTPLFTM